MTTATPLDTTAPHVSVIIPVFNQWRYTAACLEALRNTLPPQIRTEIIVVDNASTDETVTALPEWQRRWGTIRVERLPTNTGFSPACNRGAELARGEYLLFLNNDTEPTAGWLPPLIAEVQQPGVGIVAPKLLYPETRTINHAGYVFNEGRFYGIYHDRPSDLPGANKPRTYQAVLGACILLRRDVFESLGRFSLEGLEDIDLCLKARERGLASRYVPTSVVLHHGSVTLTLSPPGSFPVTDAFGFRQRWGTHNIFWDDFRWYIEDGFCPHPPGATDLDSAQRIAMESTQGVLRAAQARAAGDRPQEIQLLRESLAAWPHNPAAFARLCVSLTETGDKTAALYLLQRLGELSFAPLLMNDLEPALRVLLSPDDYAQICSRR